MSLSFASLFLGLTLGAHPVEVAVGGEVAEVEFLLDGERFGLVMEPPWRAVCDFGSELLPHELMAIARDGLGGEVGRIRQWINLPREPTELSLSLIEDGDGVPTAVRLDWAVVAGREPQSIAVALDGLPLAVEDVSTIALPPLELEQLHFLRAEVVFGEGLVSTAELVFGGSFADKVESEMTALPVTVESRRKSPTADELAGRITVGGRALEVAAVDRGPLDLVVVPDMGAREALAEIYRRAPREVTAIAAPNAVRPELRESSVRTDLDRRIEFLYPVPERTGPSGASFDLFPHSQRFLGEEAAMPQLLFGVLPPEGDGASRLADAVAVAGVTVAASNHRRGVLLLLSGSDRDDSSIEPSMARRYLESLHVPLFVWRLGDETEIAPGWGESVAAGSYAKLQAANRRLFRELDRQRIVWLVGRHLPHLLSLDGADDRIRPAGILAGSR